MHGNGELLRRCHIKKFVVHGRRLPSSKHVVTVAGVYMYVHVCMWQPARKHVTRSRTTYIVISVVGETTESIIESSSDQPSKLFFFGHWFYYPASIVIPLRNERCGNETFDTASADYYRYTLVCTVDNFKKKKILESQWSLNCSKLSRKSVK